MPPEALGVRGAKYQGKEKETARKPSHYRSKMN
jgi:hypothetical protein